ncbi:hypothetical protein [Hymenobacter sp. YC55]|uniref:hypothetical protein n=1 Tax=Hymenobacter sp. YC55 TaxID=3034019 RepID=UPI0023F87874|nr:hypothetical protein [Hymenobacter sp. YC55]MDF7815731.1 hypothetical protein [Hymenobacter sp. YC55]
MGRYVLISLCCWSWAVAFANAQHLSPPPGYAYLDADPNCIIYYRGDQLRLTLDSKSQTLLVRSDVTRGERKLRAQYFKTYDETPKASYRRKCWLLFWQKKYRRVKRPQANGQTDTILECDLGLLQRSGLFQLQLESSDATQTVNMFAYSGWTGKPTTVSKLQAPAPNPRRDELLKEASRMLNFALTHAKFDSLQAKWNKLLAQQLATHLRRNWFPHTVNRPYAHHDFAFVFAADKPIALLVTAKPMYPGVTETTEADSLRLFAKKFIKQVLLTFSDPTYSTLENDDKTPKALLSPESVKLLDDALSAWIDLGLTKPDGPSAIDLIDDGGYVNEELLSEGIQPEETTSTFRIREIQQHYRQVELIFRLRSPPPPKSQ